MTNEPYTQQELDYITFLEWLDTSGEVEKWRDENTTHEEVARKYLASEKD